MSQNTFISGKMLKSGRVCTLWSILVYFLILLDLTTNAVKAYEGPATDFSRHSIVRPTFHHGRTKREIATTRDSSGTHHPEVTLTVTIDGTEYVLDLRLNHDLVPDNHVLSYQRGGQTVHHKPKAEELDLCQYSGSVRGRSGSWAAVSTCHGVRGVIYDGEAMRYIEPQGNDIQSDHMVYDHSDLTAHHRCGYEGVTKNDSYDPLLFKQHHEELARKRSRVSRYKRDTEYEAIKVREPYNANKLSRYVELVLVVDNGEYRASGEDINAVHRQMKDLANIINSVYAPLNIFIALVGVVVWTERDEIQLLENGDETLNKFLHYRKTVLLEKIPNDNAQLVTSQNFKDSVVGKALKGFICSYEYSAGLATNHSKVLGLVAMTIAHEMGHNFGMEHDTETSCVCPDSKCIMSPSTSNQVTPVHWSSCSLKSLALSFERGMDYCLRNKPKSLFDSPTCGNGFLEEGEECDCGSLSPPGAAADCRQCCLDDCTLRSNATCGHGACCDLTTCRPKAAGTECRAADRECDLPEYCTGVSQFCPSDVYKMAATPCANNQAYCYEGTCRTHTDQCRLLWGSTGESSDQKCYRNSNTKGNEHGNCGYDRVRQIYKRCADEDAMCGLLQCRHLNERLEFGMEHAAVLSATFINVNSTIIPCRTVMVDLGLADVDPGLAPDGAKCGLNKMCLNQKCESVESVIALVAEKGSVCPSNCSGHGVCNSKGNCHCDPGFAPPICALPGSGGSYESGPATDPTVQRNFMVAMYIIFLGIIPSVLLVLFLIYYSRHNVLMWWKKPRKSYVQTICDWGKGDIRTSLRCPSVFNKLPSLGTDNSFKKMFSFGNGNGKHDTNIPSKPVVTDKVKIEENSFTKAHNVPIDDTASYANVNDIGFKPNVTVDRNFVSVPEKVILLKKPSPLNENVKTSVKLNRKLNTKDILLAANVKPEKKIEVVKNNNFNQSNVDASPSAVNKTNATSNKSRPKIEIVKDTFVTTKTDIPNDLPKLPTVVPKVNVSPKPEIKTPNKSNADDNNSFGSMNEIMNQRSRLRKTNACSNLP